MANNQNQGGQQNQQGQRRHSSAHSLSHGKITGQGHGFRRSTPGLRCRGAGPGKTHTLPYQAELFRTGRLSRRRQES